MITLIGTSTTTIGFGLCGIQDIFEVSRKTLPEELLKIIQDSKNEIIMIDEDIFNIVKNRVKHVNKTFVKIPFRHKEDLGDDEEINSLIKDTLGISVKD